MWTRQIIRKKIIRKVQEMEAKPVGILLTHGHYDHILAVDDIKAEYGVPAYACQQEAELLRELSLNMSGYYGRGVSIKPDRLLSDLEVLRPPGSPYRCSILRVIPRGAAVII